jgi:flavin reductase (DIM6/NTAB) family NADH-FMN oxidoreductase RutF
VKNASIHRRCITPSVLYPGTPVLLMTTLNDDGSSNISPLSSFWALGNRVVLGLGVQAMGYVHVRDKFALGRFTEVASTQVAPMAIAECPLQVEVSVMAMHPPGGDDGQGFVIVEGRIRCVHAHEDITVAGTQHIDVARWKPLIYLFRHYLGVSEVIGRNFRAETPMRDPA